MWGIVIFVVVYSVNHTVSEGAVRILDYRCISLMWMGDILPLVTYQSRAKLCQNINAATHDPRGFSRFPQWSEMSAICH